MSVEPGVVDTNVLVYALDADAPQHAAARGLLEAGRDPANTLYVTPQILGEFYAIVTNARRVSKPRSSAEAIAAITDMLAYVQVLPVPVTKTRWIPRMHLSTRRFATARISVRHKLWLSTVAANTNG
jgi:predicted nucleic acid-binding protein